MAKLILNVIETVGGTTLRPTWFVDGAAPSTLSSALRDYNNAVVHSVAAVASGGGYYYALNPVPSTRAWYVNEWVAVINANTYRAVQFVRALMPEVDA